MKLKLLSIAILCMAITISCDDIGSNLEPIPGYEYETVAPQSIAEAVAHIHPDKEICKEVHSAVRSAVALGLDESYYFAEAFGGNERITKASKVKRSIQSKIKSLPVGNSIKEIFTLVAEDSGYMNHYQIYWPYSDRWDGSTMPTITFQTEAAIPQEDGIGYRILNEKVEEVTVNEEYAKEHPVWIINYNPIPYEEYPDFAIQNWTREDKKTIKLTHEYQLAKRTTYYADAYIKGSKKDTKLPEYIYNLNYINFKKDTISLYLKNICLDFKDESKSFFSGGIHYLFSIGVNDENDSLLKNYTDSRDETILEGEIVSIRFTLLRSEIASSVVMSLHTLLSWNWQDGERYSTYSIAQEIGPVNTCLHREYIGYEFKTKTDILQPSIYMRCLFDYNTKYLSFGNTIYRTTLEEIPEIYNPIKSPIEFGVTKGATTPPWRIQTAK